MELRNLVEDEVFYLVEKILNEDESLCKCEKCKLDIAAIALNNLKPKYTVTEKGYVFSKTYGLKPQFNTDILTEIIKAAEIVRNNPRHKLGGWFEEYRINRYEWNRKNYNWEGTFPSIK